MTPILPVPTDSNERLDRACGQAGRNSYLWTFPAWLSGILAIAFAALPTGGPTYMRWVVRTAIPTRDVRGYRADTAARAAVRLSLLIREYR